MSRGNNKAINDALVRLVAAIVNAHETFRVSSGGKKRFTPGEEYDEALERLYQLLPEDISVQGRWDLSEFILHQVPTWLAQGSSSPLTEVIREGRCGVTDLLRSYDDMAIPHFQRGLVWDPGSVALLLESLYFGTPCGSILLWRPDDPTKHGVKLGNRPEYLIIDGQQRIRSIQDVFGHDTADRPGREEDAGQERESEAVTHQSASLPNPSPGGWPLHHQWGEGGSCSIG